MNGVIGLNHRNVEMIMGKNERKYFHLVDDKLKTKVILDRENFGSVPVISECNSFFIIETFLDTLERHGGPFVVKPARGFGGEGIVIVKNVDQDGIWNCGSVGLWNRNQQREYVTDLLYGLHSMGDDTDVAFAEEFIVAHHDIALFAKDGLPDIRVIIDDGEPIASMVRVPTSESQGKANLHAGGCATAVDIKTGITQSGWYKGTRIENHPEQDFSFAGVQIPFWNDILDISQKLFTYFPLGYMGADFTIDEKEGPVILELNARPGLEIQNVLGKGLEKILEEIHG